MSTQIHVKLVSDDPILVSTRLQKDPYFKTSVIVSRDVVVPKEFSKDMTALEAREREFGISPNIPDDQTVQVKWTEDVRTKKLYQETHLQFRKRRCRSNKSNNLVTVRAEFEAAANDPLRFLTHKNLYEAVKDEAFYWMDNDIGRRSLYPLVIVFLSIFDDEKLVYRASSRNVFYVNKFTPTQAQVENSKSEKFEITFDENVLKSAIIRRFILFLPANAVAYSVNGKILF